MEFLKNKANYRFSIISEYIAGAYTYLFDNFRKPKNVDNVGFYDYIYWDEKTILDTITKEIDWQVASDSKTTWRIDDSAYPLINYLLYNLVGFTEHDEMYSKMIREGQITREVALNRLKEDQKPRMEKIINYLNEFEISKELLDISLKKYRNILLRTIFINIKK